MIEFTYFDEHLRRYWIKAQYCNDIDHGMIIEDIKVYRETDTMRRDCTKYIPLKMLDDIERQAIDYIHLDHIDC